MNEFLITESDDKLVISGSFGGMQSSLAYWTTIDLKTNRVRGVDANRFFPLVSWFIQRRQADSLSPESHASFIHWSSWFFRQSVVYFENLTATSILNKKRVIWSSFLEKIYLVFLLTSICGIENMCGVPTMEFQLASWYLYPTCLFHTPSITTSSMAPIVLLGNLEGPFLDLKKLFSIPIDNYRCDWKRCGVAIMEYLLALVPISNLSVP
jgi:hypothetical protein